MSDSPQYEAFREFARAHIELAVLKATGPLKEEIRSLKTVLETRSTPQVIEGLAGPKGDAGEKGADSTIPGPKGDPGEKGERGEKGVGERGADGINGKDGAPSTVPGPKGDKGERGTDGIATREELNSLIEERVAEIQVRTFADVYQGVYENGRLYERGLLTTWGGSLWLSQAETRSKPGESAEWKLVVKKGADARK